MLKLALHLVRRDGGLYFRRAVPRPLINLLGAKEIKVSLRTSDAIAGRIRARLLSSTLDVLFGEFRKMTIANQEIIERARTYFAQRLSQSLEHALMLPLDETVDLNAEINSLEQMQERLRASLANQKFSGLVQSEALELLGSSNHFDKISGSSEFHFACNAVARAKLDDARILQAKLSGQYDKALPLDPWFAGLSAIDLPALPGEQVKKSGRTLTEMAEKFRQHKSKDWAKKTAEDVRRVLELGIDLIGSNKLIHHVDTDDMRKVRDALGCLPSNAKKTSLNKGMSFKELVTKSSGQSLATKTQDKYFTMFRQLFVWAFNEGLIEKVPGVGVKVAGMAKHAASERRKSYSHEQLKAIFQSPLYTGQQSDLQRHKPGASVIRDGKFWVPLIALYSGMRMGEIVQLLRSDIKCDQNIWYFDISKGEEKTLKTASSKRRVPIHRCLIEMGFLEHIAKFTGQSRIFPEIEKGKDGYYSHNFSKWWGRYARHIKVAAPKTAFHSFRHNVADALRAAELPDYTNKGLLGHADKSVHGNYGEPLKLAQLKDAIDKIDYKLDLAHLLSSGAS